jgi:carbonic anhydrase|tara:strand:- start:167 stop:811 length:645 start_codon:yes stop_codon:yes gene_type:complete
MHKHPKINRDKITPREALDLLIEGNQRFIDNAKSQYNMKSIREELKDKQQPIASILGCSDSRTSAELIFDQNLGDLFSVRLAGNIASKEAIGSLEFSCTQLGSKVIVVMGHSNCGAIKAACDEYSGGNIGEIIKLIEPAVNLEKTITEQRDSGNELYVEKVCFLNVQKQIERILQLSPVIDQMVKDKKIGIIGGVYNLSSGIFKIGSEGSSFQY